MFKTCATWVIVLTLAVSMATGVIEASGGGGTQVDTIKVSKCYYMSGATAMLVKASSSNAAARLFAYLPDGTYLCEIQNGGGSRYGGTVVPYYGPDPIYLVIVSSSGGVAHPLTTPFQQ